MLCKIGSVYPDGLFVPWSTSSSAALKDIEFSKSDDIEGRTKLYNSIVKGENCPPANVPESFNVLVKELEGLGLDVILD